MQREILGRAIGGNKTGELIIYTRTGLGVLSFRRGCERTGELVVLLRRRWARVLPRADRGGVMPRELEGTFGWGSRE